MMLRRDAGLSLIELMVALLILAVALMGLAAAFAPGRMAIPWAIIAPDAARASAA